MEMPPNPNTSEIVPDMPYQGPTLENSHYRSERARLDSFAGFPNDFMDKAKLAAAGFYYTNRGDSVQCAFCSIELSKWEPGDDPLEEHKKWARRCRFLNALEVGNTSLNSSNSSETRVLDECGLYGILPVDPSVNLSPLERLGVTRPVQGQHLGFVHLQDRLKSFETWPMALQPRPEALAAAGFFYTGQGDRCVCYQCGGGLKGWSESDDPWVEHGKLFPGCNHVILQKGREFINSCRSSITNQFPVSFTFNTSPSDNTAATNTTNSSTNSSQSSSTPSFQMPALESTSENTSRCPLEEEASCSRIGAIEPQERKPEGTVTWTKVYAKKGKKKVLICKICNEEEAIVAFLKCGHLMTCEKCAPTLKHCVVCGEEIEATVKVYVA